MFVPRNSDAVAYDKVVGDFVKDSAWHDLDLSAIVPAGAIAVLVQWGMRNSDAGVIIQLRRNGSANAIETAFASSIVANIYSPYQLRVPCDSNRIIEYYITNTGTWVYLSMIILGWWI